MVYVLLLAIHWGYGTAMISQEYNSQSTCEQAFADYKKAWGSDALIIGSCSPK